MPSQTQWAAAKARQTMYAALRAFFDSQGYLEIETPQLVPTPGMEVHIDPFETHFLPQTDVGHARSLYLHTSPEYAMKRLLADGSGPLFQIARVFRNGEVSAHHNPEFTLLEFYRPNADYTAIMADLEQALAAVETAVNPTGRMFSKTPYERLTARDAVLRETGIDIRVHSTFSSLKDAAEKAGIRVGGASSFDDVFFHLFLQKVEGKLGLERPTFLTEYPASMAALAKLKDADPTVAERVELYAQGVELGNGFSELTDSAEQRRRLLDEQAQRRAQNRPAFALDEAFLAALPMMPPSAGIAVGLDRVLMLMTGRRTLAEVLLFPAQDFV